MHVASNHLIVCNLILIVIKLVLELELDFLELEDYCK